MPSSRGLAPSLRRSSGMHEALSGDSTTATTAASSGAGSPGTSSSGL